MTNKADKNFLLEEIEKYRKLYNEEEAFAQKLLNDNRELKEEIAFLKRVIDKF